MNHQGALSGNQMRHQVKEFGDKRANSVESLQTFSLVKKLHGLKERNKSTLSLSSHFVVPAPTMYIAVNSYSENERIIAQNS